MEIDKVPETISETYIFPSPIYRIENPAGVNREDIENVCREIKELDGGRTYTNRHGWQSNDLIDLDYNRSLIDTLFDTCIDVSKTISKNTGVSSSYNHSIGASWININDKEGDYNISHCHPGSYLSFVYYVKCREDSGDIVFCDPRIGHAANMLNYDRLTEVNAIEMNITPNQGELIVFPGWLYHYVTQNMSSETRISIAINIVLR